MLFCSKYLLSPLIFVSGLGVSCEASGAVVAGAAFLPFLITSFSIGIGGLL